MRNLISELKRLISSSEEATTFDLAAGEEKKIQVARSGTFVGVGGHRVTLTPAILENLATEFDGGGYHKLKIGHGPIKTDTPDYGDVKALAYDPAADRLLATIDPSEAMIEKNRKERFRRVSMELALKPDGGYRFLHNSFLGAHDPAISGLDPVHLAASDSADEVSAFVFSEDASPEPDSVFELAIASEEPTGQKPLEAEGEPEEKETPAGGLDKSSTHSVSSESENKSGGIEMDEKQIARLARLEKNAKDSVEARVDALLAANVKKIPLQMRNAGLRSGLVAMLAAEATNDEIGTIKFAAADGKPVEETPGEFVLRMLAALPEQVTAKETEETADPNDADGSEDGAESDKLPKFASAVGAVDPEGDKEYLAAQRVIDEESKHGRTIDFMTAARRVASNRK